MKSKTFTITVSDEDADLLDGLYPMLMVKGRSLSLVVADRLGIIAPVVDHVNRNPYDNQRENLRGATRSQNMQNVGIRKDNTSGYKGVSYRPRYRQKWEARLKIGDATHRSTHDTAEEAALAYNELALEHFGEFAVLNDVP